MPQETGTPRNSPGARLRDAYSGRCIAMPGVFNPLTARMAEAKGFRCVYLSGAALSATMGVPDIGLLTMSEFVDHARRITDVCDLPLLVDADTGFGGPLNVERTVRQLERAGVAGLQIEDQQLPKRCGHLSGKSLVTAEEMAQKIRAAVAARTDPDFVVVARTDGKGVEGLDAAVDRAGRYVEAGADVIFPEALETMEEFERVRRAIQAPLLANMTEFGRSPLMSVRELDALGYDIALFPVTTLRAAMKAVELVLEELISTGSQRARLEGMQTRAELYELLGYDGYEARDRVYFGHGGGEAKEPQ